MVVGNAYHAAFHKNQNNAITSSTKGALAALSEVQLEQVHVKTFFSSIKLTAPASLTTLSTASPALSGG